ncbi:MAG: hypothetical protein LQ348_003782 [Seirophora lacunosa]|nr:MAG: hypothetical protein LQ348_003782 [Seirophora lacunosa]
MLHTTSLVSQVCLLLAFSANFTATALAESFAPPSNVYELNDHLNRLGLSQDGNADQISQSIAAASLGGVDPNRGNCKTTCVLLANFLQNATFFPASPAYQQQQSAYWSTQQAETHPACRFLPSSAREVAIIYLVAATFKCKFAVKGGGHASFAGASSIEEGVTLDLQRLNTTQVNSEGTITQVGSGNRWINVYQYLTPKNLSVVGGRVSDIGVSGLTLGGGISYFSGRHGWACDGVKKYEIVLANGQIANASVNDNPDLYWALRGGGNNFGIVTQVHLETFPQGQMLGGVNVYPITANASLFAAYQRFVADLPSDPDAALIIAFAYVQGQWTANNNYEYAKPVKNPPIFKDFFAIPTSFSTERIANLTDITAELTTYNPSGFRQTYITATFQNNAEIQRQIFDIFIEEMNPITKLTGALPALVNQPISKNVIALFRKNGGNALGLADAKGPLLLVNLAVQWSSAADDSQVYSATRRVIERAVAAAKKLGVHNRYIYQNYAARGQDVFAGYGEANQRRLIEISKKYDPKGVFQKLQPGYFKLGRFGVDEG